MWTRDGQDAAKKASSCCMFCSISSSSVYFTLTALTLLPCFLRTLMKDWVAVEDISMEGKRVSLATVDLGPVFKHFLCPEANL